MANKNPSATSTPTNTCLLKWAKVKISVWENQSSSCHLNKPINLQASDDFHNTEQVLRDRQAMLDGQWPKAGRGCEVCQKQEDSGSMSLRQHWKLRSDAARFVPQELIRNESVLQVKPTQVSVFFTNKCDMKCVYCSPALSSSWLNEVKAHKPDPTLNWFEPDMDAFVVDENQYQRSLKNFWTWVPTVSEGLRLLEIEGGEPLIQKEVWDLFKILSDTHHPELDVQFHTNLNLDPKSFEVGLEKLRLLSESVRNIEIKCSIDGWGDEVSYIRSGLNLENFEENLKGLLELPRNVKPILAATVTNLSLPSLLPLFEKVREWNKTKRLGFHFAKCHTPSHFDPDILPAKTFSRESEAILKAHGEIYGRSVSGQRLQRILTDIRITQIDERAIGRLIQVLNTLDLRRGTHWQSTFPWLAEIQREYSI